MKTLIPDGSHTNNSKVSKIVSALYKHLPNAETIAT